jgi:aromatic ring-opening dioxygenase catalytic subunit (LigB family)
MFGETFTDIPIVEVSMDSGYDANTEWDLGAAAAQLRKEGYLVLSGGLIIHNLRDFATFSEETAPESAKAFNKACLDAVVIEDVSDPMCTRQMAARVC